MSKNHENKKLKLLILVTLISIILFFLIYTIYFMSNRDFPGNLKQLLLREDEYSLSTTIYDNKDNIIKSLVTIQSSNGIDYVNYSDITINCNGKEKVALDVAFNENQEIVFYIKESNKNEVREEKILIDNEYLENSTISITKVSEGTGYQIMNITNNLDLNGYDNISYKIGNTDTWTNGSGNISFLDYDVITNELVNEDNTITISAKIQNTQTGNTIEISKNFEIDPTSVTDSISANSLIDAVENNDLKTGLYNVTVSDETYNLRVYSFDKDLKLSTNQPFGTQKDVATSSTYAQNMIVLKVDGDLTIDENITLTTYGNAYGGPKGFFIYCTGTLTNNGTISMTARGAKAEGQNVYLWENAQYETEDKKYEYVPAVGGSGGPGQYAGPYTYGNKWGITGTAGTNRSTGGGGSGRAASGGGSGSGTSGTSYSGGTGGGAGNQAGGGSGSVNGGARRRISFSFYSCWRWSRKSRWICMGRKWNWWITCYVCK